MERKKDIIDRSAIKISDQMHRVFKMRLPRPKTCTKRTFTRLARRLHIHFKSMYCYLSWQVRIYDPLTFHDVSTSF